MGMISGTIHPHLCIYFRFSGSGFHVLYILYTTQTWKNTHHNFCLMLTWMCVIRCAITFVGYLILYTMWFTNCKDDTTPRTITIRITFFKNGFKFNSLLSPLTTKAIIIEEWYRLVMQQHSDNMATQFFCVWSCLWVSLKCVDSVMSCIYQSTILLGHLEDISAVIASIFEERLK